MLEKKLETKQSSENNKRIAKNTMMLYFRMLFTMGVSLYTSRIVLNSLGVEDFGIYNVVGGIIIMFTFLNSAMANATQRFLTFELGAGEENDFRKVFSTSILIHGLIAILILILGETIGLWFLKTQMSIPPERLEAAQWVFQFSILSCMVMIVSVPYNAAIIAYEKMSAFAYISVLDVTLKLLVVFLLDYLGYDKLKLYAVLLFLVSMISRIIYGLYCKKQFKQTKFMWHWDKILFKKMANFAGWSMFGNIAFVAFTQGVNLLLNIFFGPVVNAARGIAVQVEGAVNGFVMNFQTALNPQIIKSYANKDFKYMHTLVFSSSKYSFFLLLLLSLPILLETKLVLTWWLKIVPEHTISFLRIILLTTLIDAMANPLIISVQATGKIRKYEAIVGGLLLMIVPISYIVLKLGAQPEAVFIVHLIMVIAAQTTRLLLIRPLIKLSLRQYFSEVILKICLVGISSIILPLILFLLLPQNWWSFLLVCTSSIASVGVFIYWLGLNKQEKVFIKTKADQFFNKHLNNSK